MSRFHTFGVEIAGLPFVADVGLTFLESFSAKTRGKAPGEILLTDRALSAEGFEPVTEQEQFLLLQDENGQRLYVAAKGQIEAGLLVSADGRRFTCSLPGDKSSKAGLRALNNLFRMALECRFCLEKRLSLHSACVEVEGTAYALTGVSGTGKSTRASAWVRALGAEFISGDRPCIRLDGERPLACGVPWDGKEQIYRSASAPLGAILDVKRAEETRLQRLSPDEARAVLAKQVFIPMWDTDAAFAALMNLGELSRSVPVYRLFCGPDETSAKETYEILTRHPEKIKEEIGK